MRVFRVEDDDHLGPYRVQSKWYERFASRYENDFNRYPTPAREGLEGIYFHDNAGDWLCGFASLAKLHAWFGPHLKDLRKHGYRVVEYEVAGRHVNAGKKQVIFDSSKARPVVTRSWEDIYKKRR